MLWTTAFETWGDVIASCGNIHKLLNERGMDRCNTLYFGLEDKVVDFLNCQDFINEVWYLKPDQKSYESLLISAYYNFPLWLTKTGIDSQLRNIVSTHIDSSLIHSDDPSICYRDFDLKLPDSSWNIEGPFLLFQPYSVQSCAVDQHWPHWTDALEWVSENTEWQVVVVGKEEFPTPPRVLNLVGQTKSMLDVFHLSLQAKGIITTSNALTMWSILKKKSSLVVCNQIIKEKTPYYFNWINSEPNTVLEDVTLQQFKDEFKKWSETL